MGGNDFESAIVGHEDRRHPNGVCAMRDAFLEWPIISGDVDHRFARAIRICVGNEIREMYSGVPKEELPPKIAGLLRRLDS
jgi:hypothetical protein